LSWRRKTAFSEFRGYEAWQTIAVSRNDEVVSVILGNPAMISAYQAGIPDNGKPSPDGAKMAKVHWTPKPNKFFPTASVPDKLANVDFMVKDSKRFADSGGWGYAVFDYDTATDTFKPGTTASKPPQGNDRLRLHRLRQEVNLSERDGGAIGGCFLSGACRNRHGEPSPNLAV
jgi:hypothetical protein